MSIDTPATKRAVEVVSSAPASDLCGVAVVGHGMLDTNLDDYFVTHDFERERPNARGFSYEQPESR